MHFKQNIHQHYIDIVSAKILMLQQTLADLKESGTNETKSTAGDKHETALAMLQIEQGNTRAQLHDALEQREALLNISTDVTPNKIVLGSLVTTDKGKFYLSVALGKLTVNGEIVMAISLQSPLGAKLIGCIVNESVSVNGNTFLIVGFE